MALIFSKYPNISSIDEFGKRKSPYHKWKKHIKALEKKVKRLEEQLDKESTQADADKKFAEKDVADRQTSDKKNEDKKDEDKSGDNTNVKGRFWSRLADVVLKTLPSILRAVVPMAISAFFGRGFKWGKSRKGCMA